MPDEVDVSKERPDRRRRRIRRFRVNAEQVVPHVLDRVHQAQDERQAWMDLRARRYAKFRGWSAEDEKDFPWTGASNAHIPLMMADILRLEAALFNAVLGIRPVMTAKTLQRTLKEKADRASALIDHQVFVDGAGEVMIGQYISQFVQEGTAFAFTRWARDTRRVHLVKRYPRPDGDDLAVIMPSLLTDVIFKGKAVESIERRDEAGYTWTVTLPPPDPLVDDPTEVEVEVYEPDEDRIEVVLMWPALTYDGPAVIVHDLEEIVAPFRSDNLQPVTPQNPGGALWVARRVKVPTADLRRGADDGTYDLLTEEDLLAAEGRAQDAADTSNPQAETEVKDLKDTLAGQEPIPSDASRQWVTMVEWYGPWDADGDDLEEECIFSVIEETQTLARARWLTEIFPGMPPRRPLGKASPIPVKGQLYGIGFLELMEGLHDFMHIILNQTIDNGAITNLPAGAYRASSGIKPEVLHLAPGEWIPTDNPQTDFQMFAWPGRDQSWGLNMFNLGVQMLDRLTQIGPIQQGQVPTGKASALRTVGTTMAILQQGAAMPEKILRHLFHGLAEIWQSIHALNGRYLPRRKEFLIAGKPGDSEDAYAVIEDPEAELSFPVIFDFQATLLNTNKGLMAQTLQSLGAAIMSPLFWQLGLVKPENAYNWGKDLIQAGQLDPSRYITRPPGIPEGPRILAEEAYSLILQGMTPMGSAPMEPAAEHLQKLQGFAGSPEFGFLDGTKVMLFRQWMQFVLGLVRQEALSQMVMQAAQGLSQSLGQGGQGQGVMSAMEAPETQVEAPTMTETVGATQRKGER